MPQWNANKATFILNITGPFDEYSFQGSNLSPPESRHSGTLDDLCRAAEELERIERNGYKNKQPTPLILPHEKRMQSFSPPYTPPPILSPARSLMMLSNSAERLSSSNSNISLLQESSSADTLSTPNKMWPQRKGNRVVFLFVVFLFVVYCCCLLLLVSDQRPLLDQEEILEPWVVFLSTT